jgi:flagellar protein FlgJ
MSKQEDFIALLLPAAAAMQARIGLPGSVMIAQACAETGYGANVTSDCHNGKNSLNLFNIKGQNGPAGGVYALTFEFTKDGKGYQEYDWFRAYHSYQESFDDYASLVLNDPVYTRAVAVKCDPCKYAEMLWECGYATDPDYPKTLDWIMSNFNLIERVSQLADEIENTPSDWAKDAWEQCLKAGVFDGAKPHDALTREMLAVILVKLGLVK